MAIEAVEEAAQELKAQGEGELSVYHAIVHNDTVLERLENAHQVHFVEDLKDLWPLQESRDAAGQKLSDTVVFSAHGVSPKVREEALRLG
ncbi:MAG: hypothetical protein R2865_14865 [Deinococcales bacterium]